MTRAIQYAFLSCFTFLCLPPAQCQAGGQDIRPAAADVKLAPNLPSLAQLPAGRSTALGGVIKVVDPVRDQFTLSAAGMHPTKIFYDERTQVFRDGEKISVLDLHPAQHASIQTVLDGDKIFAVSVHILSNSIESTYEGRVLNYRPDSGEISIADGQSGEPLTLVVPRDAVVAREGQRAFSAGPSGSSDLQTGTLVSVRFRSAGEGRGVADHVSILATPGSDFIFDGSISEMDLHAGFFVLVSSQEDQSFRIFVGSSGLPGSSDLHPGNRVRVTARYDGTRYIATGLTIH